jgi:hypothetical protein
MTDEYKLPPNIVAQIDQRVASFGTNLDTMIGLYKALTTQFGTAGAQAALSKSFAKQTSPENNAAFRNLLIAAVSRLAEGDHAEDH